MPGESGRNEKTRKRPEKMQPRYIRRTERKEENRKEKSVTVPNTRKDATSNSRTSQYH